MHRTMYAVTESSCLCRSCFVYDGRFSTLRLCHHRCLLQNLWLLQIHTHVWFRTKCLYIVVTNVILLYGVVRFPLRFEVFM